MHNWLFFNTETQSREEFGGFRACPLTFGEAAEAVGTLRRFPLRRERRGLRCDIIYRLICYPVKYCAALCELGRAQTLAPSAVCAPLRTHAWHQRKQLSVVFEDDFSVLDKCKTGLPCRSSRRKAREQSTAMPLRSQKSRVSASLRLCVEKRIIIYYLSFLIYHFPGSI